MSFIIGTGILGALQAADVRPGVCKLYSKTNILHWKLVYHELNQ